MRFLLKAITPTENGNEAVRNGTLGKIVEDFLTDIKPEAVYFGLENGQRAGYYIINMEDPSQIPLICERLFLSLGSSCEIIPVMTPEDLAKAGSQFESIVKKYG
jgi:hypothetical protein